VQFAAIIYDDKVKISAASGKLRWNFFIAPALREAQASRAYVLLLFKNIFSDFCQPNYLNIYRGQIFTKFAGLVEHWRRKILSYFFHPVRDVATATNFVVGIHTFVLLIEVFYDATTPEVSLHDIARQRRSMSGYR